jgi:hypothetical protein
MKLKFLLPAAAAFATMALGSCKKDSTDTSSADEIATTFELSADQGIADNTTQDANDILNDASVSYNFAGAFSSGPGTAQTSFIPTPTSFIPGCATVTVTPLVGFPKTVVIDFGTTGCTSANGVTRKGIISINVSDSFRKAGSIAIMTFNNYYVNNYKKEGTITWTNTSAAGVKSWDRVCQNGKITAPNGNYWTHFGTQHIVQSMGSSTPATIDDEFSITGTHTVTNAAGKTRTGTVLTALKKKTACNWIDSGTYQVQGAAHVAVIDYGSGTCDNIATISIDGQTPHTFTLN